MNKDNAREYIPLLEAFADGELQIKGVSGEWTDDVRGVSFTCQPDQYRRKPKPTVVKVNTNNIRDIASTMLPGVSRLVLMDAANLIDYLRTERNLQLAEDRKASVSKPLLGLVPKVVRFAARRTEVAEAITRYTKAGLDIPSEWTVELSLLNDYLSAVT